VFKDLSRLGILKKETEFTTYARPFEPRDLELDELWIDRVIHALATPADGEAVVANGEELHRFCKGNGILFLLYAGFNTNCCVLLRDYGSLAMWDRGYEVILIRDCTTEMESYDSQSQPGQTNCAVLFLEMFRAYSTISDEIICSLEELS
jgi:hypothetical protein